MVRIRFLGCIVFSHFVRDSTCVFFGCFQWRVSRTGSRTMTQTSRTRRRSRSCGRTRSAKRLTSTGSRPTGANTLPRQSQPQPGEPGQVGHTEIFKCRSFTTTLVQARRGWRVGSRSVQSEMFDLNFSKLMVRRLRIVLLGSDSADATVTSVWVARERESRTLLPVNRACSFTVPLRTQIVQPVVTAN